MQFLIIIARLQNASVISVVLLVLIGVDHGDSFDEQ